MGLTERQSDVLRFVVRERATGRDPSYRDIARAIGTSVGAAHRHMVLIVQRLGKERVDALVPMAPDGTRLRFIPVEALP